jgi:hypothetical protein
MASKSEHGDDTFWAGPDTFLGEEFDNDDVNVPHGACVKCGRFLL